MLTITDRPSQAFWNFSKDFKDPETAIQSNAPVLKLHFSTRAGRVSDGLLFYKSRTRQRRTPKEMVPPQNLWVVLFAKSMLT